MGGGGGLQQWVASMVGDGGWHQLIFPVGGSGGLYFFAPNELKKEISPNKPSNSNMYVILIILYYIYYIILSIFCKYFIKRHTNVSLLHIFSEPVLSSSGGLAPLSSPDRSQQTPKNECPNQEAQFVPFWMLCGVKKSP